MEPVNLLMELELEMISGEGTLVDIDDDTTNLNDVNIFMDSELDMVSKEGTLVDIDDDTIDLNEEDLHNTTHIQETHTDDKNRADEVAEANNDGSGIPMEINLEFVQNFRIWEYLRAHCNWKEIDGGKLDNKLYIHPRYKHVSRRHILRLIEDNAGIIYFKCVHDLETYVVTIVSRR